MTGSPSYDSGSASQPLLGEAIGANLRRTARDHPQRDATVVCHQDARLTYAELGSEVGLVASALIEAEVECGDRVGLRKGIVWSYDLPKTRSGKIVRRLLRDIAEGRELGAVTTLRDPSVVERLKQVARASDGGGDEADG